MKTNRDDSDTSFAAHSAGQISGKSENRLLQDIQSVIISDMLSALIDFILDSFHDTGMWGKTFVSTTIDMLLL